MKSKEESLGANEVMVLGDFAENYQYLIQDEIQSYHWSKEYCTLHPLIIDYKDADGNLQLYSLCYISDDNTYDTSFVYKIQRLLVEFLKQRLPSVTKIYYVSDGCGGQYKNFKNFLNLCCHKEDFSIEAEWIFFATSHGKSPCDGIGGAVKRHAAKRSLQRPLNNLILNYRAMLEVCQEEMKSIISFGFSKEDMLEVRAQMEKRFEEGKQCLVPEAVIISFHCQHHKSDTNCAMRMSRLQISMTSKFQLKLTLEILHHHLIFLACIIHCGGSVW